jgi:Predicted oxidoreductase related to nitroreductase
MANDFYSAVAERRTFYGVSKETVASDEKIKEIIEHAIKYTPSAFNSQGTRVVLLLGKQHDRLWDITKEALKRVVPAENFKSTEEKINSFRSGYGTILYYEDFAIVEGLQKKFALYKDNFPVWAQQTNGMHQYVIWTALQMEGFGASLQHYSELIEEDVRKEWNIPESWKLIGQMPFGKPIAEPNEKQYQPVEERIKVFE